MTAVRAAALALAVLAMAAARPTHRPSSRTGLADLAAPVGRPVLFTEAGYTRRHGTVTAPWAWSSGVPEDQAEQSSAYRALWTRFGDEPWWAGVLWWNRAEPPDPASAAPLGHSPRGTQAEQVVRESWAAPRKTG